ncbi:hypothetical protein HDE_04048 [Halotydeus destructor]|nr:hypothetical protein HDE_04048 [Halotydeus destructor]
MAAILSAIGLLVLVFIVISDATNHSDNHKDISSFTFKAEVIEILDELSDQFNSNETTETELKSRQASSNPVGDLISGVLGVLTGNQRQPDKPPNKDDPPIESQNQRMFNCEPNERQVTTIKSDQGQFCCVSQESGQTNYCKSFRCVSKSASSGCCTVPGMKQRFCPGLMSGRCKKSERRYNYVDEKQGSARSCCVTSSHQQRFCSMQRCASFLNGCCQVQRTQNRFCPGYFATFTAILVGGIFGKPQTTGTNTGTGSNGGYGGNGFGTGAGQSDGDKTSTTTTSGPPTTSKGTTVKGKPRPKPVVTTEAAYRQHSEARQGQKETQAGGDHGGSYHRRAIH